MAYARSITTEGRPTHCSSIQTIVNDPRSSFPDLGRTNQPMQIYVPQIYDVEFTGFA